jgi:hypothetical protein
MLLQKVVHNLPLDTDPLAMHNPQFENPTLYALFDIVRHHVSRFIRGKLVQIESTVDRILDRLVSVNCHLNLNLGSDRSTIDHMPVSRANSGP